MLVNVWFIASRAGDASYDSVLDWKEKRLCSLPDHPKFDEPISCFDQCLVNYNYLGWMVIKSGLLITKPSNIYLQLSNSFVH